MEGGDLGEDEFIELVELAVEVFTTEACSEVTRYDTVGIEHRDNVKCEVST
jgi:hypothetical protein